jgi:putative Mg2+ transporter-C (MgtC) family protein
VTDAAAIDPAQAVFWARLGAAVLCGGAIGLERQVRGKPAGLRTSILLCAGTMFFVAMGAAIAGEHGDPTRTLGQVIVGVGFVGGGVILARGRSIYGVTSASVIWVLAAIGTAIGLGFTAAAIAVTAVTLFILVVVAWLERRFLTLRRSGEHEGRQPISLDK